MLHVMKNNLTHIVNNKKIIFDKIKNIEKCDMTSANLEKTLEYLKIQESLRSGNLTHRLYLCKGIFYMFFSTLRDIQAKSFKKIIGLAKT